MIGLIPQSIKTHIVRCLIGVVTHQLMALFVVISRLQLVDHVYPAVVLVDLGYREVGRAEVFLIVVI